MCVRALSPDRIAWMAASAAGCLLLLGVAAANGTTPLTLVVSLAFLVAVFLPAGALLTERVGIGVLSRSERIVLAVLVGHVACAVVVFVAGVLRVGPLVWPAFVALAVLAARRWRAPVAEDERPASGRPHWSLPLVVPAALFAVTGMNPAFQRAGDAFQYVRTADHTIHLSHYWELVRGVPPPEIPTVAGVPFGQYHVLGYLPGLLLVRAGLLDVVTVLHEVAPTARFLLLMAALYLIVRVRTGDGRLATAAIPAVFVLGHALEGALARHVVRMPGSFLYMLRSESGGAGLVVWATVFALLAVHARTTRQSGSRALLLAAALAGLSWGFKAHLFLLFGSAFLFALALLFARDRWRALLGAAALAIACFAALFLSWPGADSSGQVQLAPGAFARVHILRAAREPTPWAVAAATLLGFARVTLFSPLVPAFLVATARRFRSATLFDLTAVAVFPAGLAIMSLLGARMYELNVTGTFIAQAAHGVALTSLVVTFLLAVRWTVGAERRPTALLGAVLLACALVAPVLPPPQMRPGPVLRAGERCALRFLREQTALDAVVMTSGPDGGPDGYSPVAAFAGRRTMVVYAYARADREHDRAGDVRLFYRTHLETEAERIVDRYGIDYVMERPSAPLRFPTARLRLRFEQDGHRVYETLRFLNRPGAPSAPPGAYPLLAGPPALTCP